jgi:hypothetical protein
MRDIRSARLHFDAGHVATADSDELLTEVFFDYLGDTGQAPSAPTEAGGPVVTLTADIKSTLVKLLAKFIGPMAEIICLDHFEGATNALSAIEAIANEIPSRVDADKFRADAKRVIG